MSARPCNAVSVILKQRMICKKYYGNLTALAVILQRKKMITVFQLPKNLREGSWGQTTGSSPAFLRGATSDCDKQLKKTTRSDA